METLMEKYGQVNLAELTRLAELLKGAGMRFDWIRNDGLGGAAIKLPSLSEWQNGTGPRASVILNRGSYGHEHGLLECWVKGTGVDAPPEGWLSAARAFEILRGAGL